LRNLLGTVHLSWQLDIWTELRTAENAAALCFLGTGEGRDCFVTRLVAEIADHYFDRLAPDKRPEILDQTIHLHEQSHNIGVPEKEAPGAPRWQSSVSRPTFA
jgi:hypothetical protein